MSDKSVFDLQENYDRYGLYVEVEDGKPARTGIDEKEAATK